MATPDGLGSTELLAAARRLLEAAPRRRDSAQARRAVSTAYYAMFHCFARICADNIASGRGVALRPATRQTVYRSLQHGRARRRFRNQRLISSYPEALRAFAEGFVTLQQQRHLADYDPTAVFRAADARELVEGAARLISGLLQARDADLLDFALRVLLPERDG